MQTWAQRQHQSQKPALSSLARRFSQIPRHPPTAGVLQAKLAINKPGDEHEQEADRISGEVMQMREPQLQRACACGGGCPRCQAKQSGEGRGLLQTTSAPAGNSSQTAAPSTVHDALAEPGQPLDIATRDFMEPRFGGDFSRVRIHTGAAAERSAQDVNAHAYSVGNDIVFGPGEPSPATHEGRRLLAHELTHVVQQAQRHAQLTMQRDGKKPKTKEEKAEELASKQRIKERAERPFGQKNIFVDTIDGIKLIFDPFDQSLIYVLQAPDDKGNLGYLLTYSVEENPDGTPILTNGYPTLTKWSDTLVPLSPMRVKALAFIDTKQGTYQETETEAIARRQGDIDTGNAARAAATAYNEKKMKEYTEALAAGRTVAKPVLKPLPEDKRLTLCNNFPPLMASAIGARASDPVKGGATTAVDTGNLANFEPRTEGLKRGSWRTLDTNPEGPKPGDVYSLGNPRIPGRIEHLGVFRSSRPGQAGTNTTIWTVIDGGQGSYEGRNTVLERTRVFHNDTKLLTSPLADAGQLAEERTLRGWIDIEAHLKAPQST